MKAPSFVLIGAGLLAALAGRIAWDCARSIQQAESALRVLAGEKSRASAELRRQEDRLATASQAPATPSRPVVPENLPAKTSAFTKFLEAQKDPKSQLLQLAAARARAASSYGLLFRKLALTPAQIDKFKDALAKRDEQRLDLNNVLHAEPPSPATVAAVQQFRAQSETDYEAAQQQLLGAAGYAQLLEYERTLPVQNSVSSLAGTAVLVGAPFTEPQAEQLTQILANATSSYQSGGAASPDTVDWDVVEAQAQSILSAPQLAVLKNIGAATAGRFWTQFVRARTSAVQADALSAPAPARPTPSSP